MLGDWLRAGNQVWLGKYWDSRAGGGLQRGERAQVRRDVSRGRVTFQHTQHCTGTEHGAWLWRRMSNTQWSLWLPDTLAPYPQVEGVYRDWGSLALLNTGPLLSPTNRGVQNKCSNICSGLFFKFVSSIEYFEARETNSRQPLYCLGHYSKTKCIYG